MSIVIERVRLEDVDSILEIQTESGLSEWSGPAYRTEISNPDAITLQARGVSGEVLGFITGRVIGGGISIAEAEIYNIGVRVMSRQTGVGSRLLSAFLGELEKRRVVSVWLDVRVSNKTAISFYRRHGFVSVGLRPKFYSRPDEDAEIMRRSMPDTGR